MFFIAVQATGTYMISYLSKVAALFHMNHNSIPLLCKGMDFCFFLQNATLSIDVLYLQML